MAEERVKECRYQIKDGESTRKFIGEIHRLARENPELIYPLVASTLPEITEVYLCVRADVPFKVEYDLNQRLNGAQITIFESPRRQTAISSREVSSRLEELTGVKLEAI